MAIMRWDPFGEVLRMQRDMDQIFSRMGLSEGRQGSTSMQGWMPKVNIKQSGDDMQIHAELPGLKPEDVDVEVTEGVLTIRGERRAEEEKQDEGWLVRESSYGSFQRSIALPENVDPNSIRADYHDGILELTVPKAFERVSPQTTKVQIGNQGAQPAMTGQQGGTQQGEQAQGQQTQQSQQEQSEQQQSQQQREHVNY